jgi:hypothetical protein
LTAAPDLETAADQVLSTLLPDADGHDDVTLLLTQLPAAPLATAATDLPVQVGAGQLRMGPPEGSVREVTACQWERDRAAARYGARSVMRAVKISWGASSATQWPLPKCLFLNMGR